MEAALADGADAATAAAAAAEGTEPSSDLNATPEYRSAPRAGAHAARAGGDRLTSVAAGDRVLAAGRADAVRTRRSSSRAAVAGRWCAGPSTPRGDPGSARSSVVVGPTAAAIEAALPAGSRASCERRRRGSGSRTACGRSCERSRGGAQVGAVCVGLADQPFVGPDAYRRLAAAYDAGATLAVATYDGRAGESGAPRSRRCGRESCGSGAMSAPAR